MSSGVDDNALLMLKSLIRIQMNDYTDALIQGVCDDFAEYKYQTGIIHGLAIAERELLDLNKRIEEA